MPSLKMDAVKMREATCLSNYSFGKFFCVTTLMVVSAVQAVYLRMGLCNYEPWLVLKWKILHVACVSVTN